MPLPETDSAGGEHHLKEINEELYKRNLELALRNKILSLLRELYQISILALEPEELAKRVSEKVRAALDFELFGIYLLSPERDLLSPLSLVTSSQLLTTEGFEESHLVSQSIRITKGTELARSILEDRVFEAERFEEIWGESISPAALKAIAKAKLVESILILPISMREMTAGVLILGMNRSYTVLSAFEKESISNFVNIIAVALDKAMLYKEIGEANLKLKELDRQKSEFVSIASHQLRSPLTAMKGYSSMLLEGSFGEIAPKATEAVERIFQSSQRLVVIIEDFLNLSRIEQGRMQYEFGTVELKELVASVVKEMSASAANSGLYLNFESDDDFYNITADAGKARQVINNLVDNAIKYTQEGGITIRVNRDEKSRKILLAISDTGIGIEPGVSERLFAKFSRATDAGKVNMLGTGLGLYVAKEIMIAHHGSIWVDSDGPGKGSTFYLEFMAE